MQVKKLSKSQDNAIHQNLHERAIPPYPTNPIHQIINPPGVLSNLAPTIKSQFPKQIHHSLHQILDAIDAMIDVRVLTAKCRCFVLWHAALLHCRIQNEGISNVSKIPRINLSSSKARSKLPIIIPSRSHSQGINRASIQQTSIISQLQWSKGVS